MIKFFRHLRHDLLSQGKTRKYLSYAIGEIILVVIGILIALQINNWNENRKIADKTKFLFEKANNELPSNIVKANMVINVYRNKDSICYRVINKLATKEDYSRDNSRYPQLLTYGEIVELSDDAFQKLNTSESNISKIEDSLISQLQPLYSTIKAEVDVMDAYLPEYIFELNEKYRDEQEWYYDYVNFRNKKSGMINYYLNNQLYLNDLTYYRTKFLGQHLLSTIEFRNYALKQYKDISHYLNIKIDTSIVKDLKQYKHYLGVYKNDKNFASITSESDNLKYTIRRNIDSSLLNIFKLYPDTKTYFTIGIGFGQFIYNDNNELTQLLISNCANNWTLNKIK